MSRYNLLFIGDIVGAQGVETVVRNLSSIIEANDVDFCIANAENSHQGRGINEVIVKRLYKAGVDVITGGDHSFDKHLIFPYMRYDRHLLRPVNYPPGTPGFGYGIYEVHGLHIKIGVINLRGQVFFHNPINCPFRTADKIITQISETTKHIFVDFHAEATAEKYTMAWYLHERISAMAGTHTHVPTADEQVFPGGMGYITDVGFTGPHNSVIGMSKETAINRFLLQIPQKYELGSGLCRLNGVIFSIDIEQAKTHSVRRISLAAPEIGDVTEPDENQPYIIESEPES